MSDIINFQDLSTKPVTSKLKEFNVQINIPVKNEEGIVEDIDVKIEDKTKDKLISRAKFMKSIKSKIRVINSIEDKIKGEEEEPTKTKVDKKKVINKLIITPNQRKKLKEKQTDLTISAINEVNTIQIGDEIIENRLPVDKETPSIIKSSYFLNNREKFIVFVNNMFKKYRKEVLEEDKQECSDRKSKKERDLFTHQRLIRDYINLYTPYRGVLLYHGLGSGKTCSSIAISENILKNIAVITAESIITTQKVLVMTPASLQPNYIEQLKECGNPIYRKKQFWEFISTDENPEQIEILSSVLSLPISFIKEHHGAWLVNVKKESNYNELSDIEQKSLNKQLNTMIKNKFEFRNYNGLSKAKLKELTASYTINMFDNKVVCIDEAHNLVSRIVNKIEKEKYSENGEFKSNEISIILYNMLMSATNCKIVLLSGTPIINYPNEIGILFNILRGYIKIWHIPVNETSESKQRITLELIKKILNKNKHLDYISYNSNILSITRNPFGFINRNVSNEYKGVKLDVKGDYIDDNAFIDDIIKKLTSNNIQCIKPNIKIVLTKSLPDKLNDFNAKFIDSDKGDVKNQDILKRRIVGLTSYLNDKENLMPQYDKDKDYHEQNVYMSNYQFNKYQDVRNAEISKDLNKRKSKNLFTDSASSYRIFSRSFCNFVFPEEYPRPFPNDGSIEDNIESDILKDEDDIDGIDDKEKVEKIESGIDIDDVEKTQPEKITYQQKIRDALDYLSLNSDKLLSVDSLEDYSPKFLHILQNILNTENIGLHLIYSQFRTLEGIGIFSLVLKANGFLEFRLKKNSAGQYILDIPEGIVVSQRMFALYTGTESMEEKEIIRNIYNGDWELLSSPLSAQLKQIAPNNNKGEIIKVMMISASGAEGINLKNTRFVHIMEPYWHPVRTEQVIGRARRICSHENLEEPLRNVKVILYLMKFTDEQIKTASSNIQRFDVSKYNKENKKPLTTDQNLSELSKRKSNIHKQLLKCVKETAIDCAIQFKSEGGEDLECYSFAGETDPNVFSYQTNIVNEETDKSVQKLNEELTIFRAKRFTGDGKDFAMKLNDDGKPSGILYDMDMYKKAKTNPKLKLNPIGKVIKKPDGTTFIDYN